MSFKKGVSGVVTTVLLVVISIVAVAVVWNVVGGIIKSSTEDIENMDFTMNFRIEKVEIIDGLTANVKIKRGAGKGECSKLKIILTGAKDSQIHETTECLEELETKTFSIDLEVIPEKVEVAPIIGTDKGEKTGNLADSLEDKNFVETYNNLVGYWKLDGNANDETGVNHGEARNGVEWRSEGKVGGSAYFAGTGSNQYISIADRDNLDFASGDFTFMAWVNVAAVLEGEPNTGLNYEILDNEILRESGYLFRVNGHLKSAGKMHFRTNQVGTYAGTTTNGPVISQNKWHHVTAVKEGSTGMIYIDSVRAPDNEATMNSPVAGTKELGIGGLSRQSFYGELDEIKIYNKALTADQVNMIYESEK